MAAKKALNFSLLFHVTRQVTQASYNGVSTSQDGPDQADDFIIRNGR